ncbi:MAG: hypothetical protein OXG25_07640 [Gammaproteobacteria bacterium]|nr:hypothetical protein [Gammaproteobacteria bacterium]
MSANDEVFKRVRDYVEKVKDTNSAVMGLIEILEDNVDRRSIARDIPRVHANWIEHELREIRDVLYNLEEDHSRMLEVLDTSSQG